MQYRTVIVDDELVSRSRLKEFLVDTDFFVVQDFSSPAQALEWFESDSADVVIVDMNMPKISGSEFLRMLKLTASNEMIFLAVSGYDDFEYARECIVVGVEDYLLKHSLTKETLINTLHKACARLEKSEQSPFVNTEKKILKEMLHGHTPAARLAQQTQALHLRASNLVLLVLWVDISTINRSTGFVRQQNNLTLALLDTAHQLVGVRHKCVCESIANGEVTILLSFEDVPSQNYILSFLGSLNTKLRNSAMRLLNTTLSVGVSHIFEGFEAAAHVYERLTAALQNRFYDGPQYTCTSMKPLLPARTALGCTALPEELVRLLQYELRNAQHQAAYDACASLFAQARQLRWQPQRVATLTQAMVQAIASALDPAIGSSLFDDIVNDVMHFQFLTQHETCTQQLCERAVQAMQTAQRESNMYCASVAAAVQYIQQNYTDNISLESCSSAVGVSYTHLSRIFAIETGEKFNEFLSKVRLKRAKALILSGKYKFADIYQAVGFGSYNYFFKVFKRFEKMTPSDFALAQNITLH